MPAQVFGNSAARRRDERLQTTIGAAGRHAGNIPASDPGTAPRKVPTFVNYASTPIQLSRAQESWRRSAHAYGASSSSILTLLILSTSGCGVTLVVLCQFPPP